MVNIFDITHLGYTEESFDTLFENASVKIERIVTRGQVSPEGFYYDQVDGEWILVLEGEAELGFTNQPPITLKKGDSLFLAPHKKHRVNAVSENVLWLAVFIKKTN